MAAGTKQRPSSVTCYSGTPNPSKPIAAQYTRLDYLREKAALWDARANGDAAAEAAAQQRVVDAFCRMDIILISLHPINLGSTAAQLRATYSRAPGPVIAGAGPDRTC